MRSAFAAKRPAPVTRIAQADGSRYRLRYTKLGRIAYLGHLDLIRHLPRVFRRAGLEVFYSVGFHPKPELSFGPALGLGIPSLGELLDVKLIDRVPAAELVRRLLATMKQAHADFTLTFRALARVAEDPVNRIAELLP